MLFNYDCDREEGPFLKIDIWVNISDIEKVHRDLYLVTKGEIDI